MEDLTFFFNSKPILQALVTNEVLQLFQEPDVTSKREPRVFLCSKDV
jgi:hypothetical protein